MSPCWSPPPVVDNADAGGLGAKQAWLYVTILTVAASWPSGLAKAGAPAL